MVNVPEFVDDIETRIMKTLRLSRFKNQLVGKGYITGLKAISYIINIPKPTVLTGKGSSTRLCETIAQFGLGRLLIVTDSVLYKMGLLEEMLQALEKNGTPYTLFAEVEPDPTFAIVEKGLSLYRQENCGGVIAVGGGSSIDAAKVIALAATNEVEPRALVGIIKGRKSAAPFFAIPTTAGTGSEATIGAVISDSKTHNKELIIDHKVVPMMCALDPGLMTGLPAPITAATGMDALTHLIEGYLSGMATEESDFYARSGVQMVFQNLVTACKKGTNIKARENMSLASFYGGLVVNSAGLGYGHAFAHQLGRLYKMPHGIANAKVLPFVLEYNKFATADRMAELARVIGLETAGDDALSLADKFIDAVKKLIQDVGIVPCVQELKKNDYGSIIRNAFKEANSTYAVAKYMSYDDAEELLDALAGNCSNSI